ncbi:ClpX C4-type zinc finger protein [Kitasatospora sp. NPDC059827]|uniref:ClpX C4-type zinc finger protein n=1 Tax=Kitasatospora sp. NPDC059827 TaxID=3346964 RepID=UPI0036531BE8
MTETICTQLLRYGPAAVHCSFCGATHRQRDHLVSGPGVAICSGCIELITVIMRQNGYQPPT